MSSKIQEFPPPQKLCTFCLKVCKVVDSSNDTGVFNDECDESNEDLAPIITFTKFLERFVGENQLKIPAVKTENWCKWLGSCDNCRAAIESLCSTYHQFKYLELQLEWKLKSLVSVMKTASRIPSRVQQLRSTFRQTGHEGDDLLPANGDLNYEERMDNFSLSLGKFQRFRNNVIKKGEQRQTNSFPQVFVKRIDKSDSRTKLDCDLEQHRNKFSSRSTVLNGIPPYSDADVENVQFLDESPAALEETGENTTPQNIYLTSVDEMYQMKEDLEMQYPIVNDDVKTKMGLVVDNSAHHISSTPDHSQCPDFSVEDLDDFDSDTNHETEAGEKSMVRLDGPPILTTAAFTDRSIVPMFICELCSKTFKENWLLKRHMTTQHLKKKSKQTDLKEQIIDQSASLPLVTTEEGGYGEHIREGLLRENVEVPEEGTEVRYNFRKKIKFQKTDYNEEEEMDSSHSDFSLDNGSEESLSSSDDEFNVESVKREQKPIVNLEIPRGQNQIDKSRLRFCRKDGCFTQFVSDTSYQEHQLLHEQGQYKCNFCDSVENSVIGLCNHERTFHPKHPPKSTSTNIKTIHCPRCEFATCRMSKFQWHFAEIHLEEFQVKGDESELISCEICKMKIANDLIAREGHLRKYHHEQNGVKMVECPMEECDALFTSESQMCQHVRVVHQAKSASSYLQMNSKAPKKYKCPVDKCLEKFLTLEKMEAHHKLHGCYKCAFCDLITDHAGTVALHETEHAIRAETSVSQLNEKRFTCARCPKNFYLEYKYVRHYINKHLNLSSKLPIQTCPICSSESRGGTYDYFQKHYRIYHKTEGMDPSEIQRCLLCPAYFVKSEQLTTHIITIHFKRKCPECEKFFPIRPRSLREHIEQRHPLSNAFPHLVTPCDMGSCKRRFASEAELKVHKERDRHYDEKMMECSKCSREFQGEEKLRAHMHSKHSEKTIMCPECGKGFNKNKLNIHLEYHKDPTQWKFKCDTCGKKCVDKHKLAQHQRTHTKLKSFICQFCGEKYAHRHNWVNHIKSKHNAQFKEAKLTKSKTGNFLSRKGFKKGVCVTTGAKVAENVAVKI